MRTAVGTDDSIDDDKFDRIEGRYRWTRLGSDTMRGFAESTMTKQTGTLSLTGSTMINQRGGLIIADSAMISQRGRLIIAESAMISQRGRLIIAESAMIKLPR